MLRTNKRPAPEVIFRLFGAHIQEEYTQEDLDYCQLQFLSTNTSPELVESLVKGYSLCPWLVTDTLLLIYDDPSICSLPGFSYDALVKALDTNTCLVEELCARRTSIYLNLLYRVSWSVKHSAKLVEDLDILLNFKSCLKVFENRVIWGLNRERAGVVHSDDETVMEMASSCPILDITRINRLRMETRRLVHGITDDTCEKDEFDEQRPMSHLQSALAPFILSVSSPYHLPSFLDIPFSSLKGFSLRDKLSHDALAAMLNTENRLYDILMKLVPNPVIKENFCALIRNVYQQDRTKLKFDEATNCSDSFCYSALTVLMRIARGIFNDSFIDKIDEKRFPTFCFFNISRMMEISLLRLMGDIKEEYNAENSLLLLRRHQELVQQYFNFVYDVIDRRRDEVVGVLKRSGKEPSNPGDAIDFTPENKKAARVSEILEDSSFVSTILSLQPAFDCRAASRTIFALVDIVFMYKNGMKGSAIRILGLMNQLPEDPMLVRRLISHYSNKHDDEIVENRFILHEILRNTKVDVTNDALRMVSVCLGSFEEKISQIFDFISSINQYRSKGTMLESLLKDVDNEAFGDGMSLSDDEEDVAGIPRHALEAMARMTDAGLRTFLRSRVSGDFDTVYNDVKCQIAYLDSEVKTKIYMKLKVNKHRMENAKKSLKGCSVFLERLLSFLKSFTVINKRLFLNKSVFFRMFSIINSALNLLVGERSLKVRIPNKDEYCFSPKEILRSVELIILNMLRNNEKLTISSGVDAALLERAIELSQRKHMLMDDQVASLIEILGVLREMDRSKQPDVPIEDVPDEFLDPLTYLVMENPVTLLTSRVTIDRSTFNQIMLNDQTDPFSRASLDESKIVENLELGERIREFWKGKR